MHGRGYVEGILNDHLYVMLHDAIEGQDQEWAPSNRR